MSKKKKDKEVKGQKSIDEVVEEEKAKVENPSPTEKSDGDEEEEDIQERKGISCILADGSLVEMLYDGKKHTSKLAKYTDGEVTLEDSVPINDYTVFMPMAPNQPILENGFIVLPSGVTDYQSNEALYHEVRAFIDKYVKLTDEFLTVVAVYVMMSWLFDKFQNIPYLRAIGLHGTGKSRLLQVAGHVCYKAVLSGGSTSLAALFRSLELFKPTLVFDEADLGEKESVEMRQVLRQGYSVGAPVSRMDKGANGKMYIQTFHVFGPKIIASQSDFKDPALESRCLTEHMYPTEGKERPIELSRQFYEEALLLRNKLLMFRFKNHGLVIADEEALDDIKLPRLKQTGLAVVSVAKILGAHPQQEVVEFLLKYEVVLENQMTDTVEHDILLCLLDLMTQKYIRMSTGKVRIGTDLTEAFSRKNYEEYSDRKNDSNSPHSVMKHPSYKVSPKKMGWYIRRMGLRVERDSSGFFIPVFAEYQKIRSLAKRYRLDRLFEIPEKEFDKVKKLGNPVPKELRDQIKDEKAKQLEEQREVERALEKSSEDEL